MYIVFPKLTLVYLQGAAQIYIRVDDVDTGGPGMDDAEDDLVTRFYIEVGVEVSEEFTGGIYFGNKSFGRIIVSYRVMCTKDFYGENCAIFCVERDDDELGHYTCDSEGNRVCREGYRDPSNNCTECIPAEGCCKS